MSFISNIVHHGAVNGVTGSCHELQLADHRVLIDCGMFQGAEVSGQEPEQAYAIDFDVRGIDALVVTHCHIDHVGRIPFLLAAGFDGPIYCSKPTAYLLPMVIEDAIKVGVSRKPQIINAVLNRLKKQLVALDYGVWQSLTPTHDLKVKLSPAGHILGSAFVTFDCKQKSKRERVVFSGDLGACYSPLLAAPRPPYACDRLVIESTYGDQNHEGRRQRRHKLYQLLKQCVADNGVVLIPAFSIGRTQELLYEMEEMLHRIAKKQTKSQYDRVLDNIDIIVDSPLAAHFTESYRTLSDYWDKEASRKLKNGRHPLSFENLTTIDSHDDHLKVIDYLKKRELPAIVIAASGMCSGGRIVNYLKAFIEEATTDILFAGYQAKGTTGRIIQRYGPRKAADKPGYVDMDGQRYMINAKVHTLSGYSAHADQKDLIRFVKRMRYPPQEIRIVHGDDEAKAALKATYQTLFSEMDVIIGEADGL